MRPGSATAAPLRVPPRRTSAAPEQRICAVRRSQGSGRTACAGRSGSPAPPAVLRRFGNRLDRLHRVTRAVVRCPRRPAAYRREKAGPRGRRTPRARALRPDPAHPRPRLPPGCERGGQALAAFGRRGVRVRGSRTPSTPSPATSAAWLPPLAWNCGTPGPTARKPTARPSASSRSCRTIRVAAGWSGLAGGSEPRCGAPRGRGRRGRCGLAGSRAASGGRARAASPSRPRRACR